MADARVAHLLGAAGEQPEPDEHAPRHLLAAVELLKQAHAGGFAQPEALAPESFLECAEAALQRQRVELARDCVERFFDARPGRNQYLVRAHFALGLVEAAECSTAKGEALVKGTLKALQIIKEGISLASELGHSHRFLVYNGSVHAYNTARPLLTMVAGANELAAIFDSVVKALAAAEEPDLDWRLKLSMEQARSMERAGRKKEATPIIQAALPLAKEASQPRQEQLLQLQVHLLSDDAGALKKLRDENEKVPRRKGLLITQLLADRKVADAAAEVKAAIAALDPPLSQAMFTKGSQADEKEKVYEAVAALKGDCNDDDVLISLASQAASNGQLELAFHCATRCANSRKLTCRVRSLYLREWMRVKRLDDDSQGPAQGLVYTKHMVATRIEALKRLQEGLLSARRSGDQELVQDGCILIWNVALPLLQPSLVQHVEPMLYKAAAALEDLQSPLLELRAALHLELARLEYSKDYIQKAYTEAQKGLALDLPTSATGMSPVERELRQLSSRLLLQLDMYMEATAPEDRATLLLTQAAAAKQPALKQRLLVQVLKTMQDSEPEAHGEGSEEEVASLLRHRATLWAELMKSSWQQRLPECSKEAASAVLVPSWDTIKDADLVRLQADARFVLAEVQVAQIQQIEAGVTGEADMARRGSDAGVAEKRKSRVRELRQGALAEMCKGIELGLALKDDLIVHNGCIYVCNYNQASVRAQDWEPLMPALRQCVAALRATSQRQLRDDLQLLKLVCFIASSLAQALEVRATHPPSHEGEPRKYDAKDAGAVAALKEADEACKWAAELASGRHRIKKGVTAVWARVQTYLGAKEPNVGTEPEAGALGLLEVLASRQIDAPAARAAALAKAKELLRSDGFPRPEPELWVSVAQQALVQGDLASVVQACEAALRPMSGAGGSEPLRDDWRWYAMSEYVHAEAIFKLLRPTQQAELQEQLHIQALVHLSKAMLYARNAQADQLLVSAAQRFWRHIKPLANTASRLPLLREPVTRAVEQLEALDATLQPQVVGLRVRLYEILLSIFADARAWSEGVALLQRAFRTLPESEHEPLWEQKVRFICKGGGRNLAGEMHRLKDFNSEVQARIWAVMAASSEKKGEQMGALIRAADAVKSTPLKRVDYLISLAEWLFCNEFPLKDAEDQLLSAVDILMDNEDESPEGADDDEEDAQSSVTRNSGATSVLKPSTAVSTTASTKAGKAGDAVLLISQYEQLARVYLMRAMMATTATSRLDCVLIAHHYIGRIWALAVPAANAAAAAAAVAAGSAAPTPWSLPEEAHEWVDWMPDRGLREIMANSKSPRMICETSFPHAQLSASYLRYAVDTLLEHGLTLHVLMPLSLLHVLAADVLSHRALERAVLLQTAHVQLHLGMAAAAETTRALIGALGVSAEQRRTNELMLRELRTAQTAEHGLAMTTTTGAGSTGLGAPPRPRPSPRTCLSEEGCWLQFAGLLLDEGQWAAAQEWLDEAAMMLEARGNERELASCMLLRAKLHHLQGELDAAVHSQLKALQCPLEMTTWASSIVQLAEYQAATGDNVAQRETLTKAAQVCEEAVAEFVNAAPDAMCAQATVQRALAHVSLAEALSQHDAGLSGKTELARAKNLLDSAVHTLLAAGHNAEAVRALSERTQMHRSFPSTEHDAEHALEAESTHLQELGELLIATLTTAERQVFVASPRALPITFSLPVARELAEVKVKLAAYQLQLANLRAKERAAQAELAPSYPIVEGRDDPGIAAFVRPPLAEPPRTHMLAEELSLLYSSSALAHSGASDGAKGRALLSMGLALLANARVHGHTPDPWIQPANEDAPVGESQAASTTEKEEMTLGEQRLSEAVLCSLASRDWATCAQAAIALAQACGKERTQECARWLCLHHCCISHSHWKQLWYGACTSSAGKRDRFAHLASLVNFLSSRWHAPQTLEVMREALEALEANPGGCAAWRALAVPEQPLEGLLRLLKPELRFIQLSVDTNSNSVFVMGIAAYREPVEKAVKGAPEPELKVIARVGRLEGITDQLNTLVAMAEAMRRAQTSGGLARNKAELYGERLIPSTPRDGVSRFAAVVKCAEELPTEEVALRQLVSGMDALFGRLLEPLQDILGPELPQGVDALTVILAVDPSLSLLPFECLEALRQPHVNTVSRDVSAAVLATRLARDSPATKRGQVGVVVDPRDEVLLPSTNNKESGKQEPMPLCESVRLGAMATGVLAGGTALLGAAKLPSTAEWQRLLLASGAFVYIGPGPLLAQLAPEAIATLPLSSCNACIVLDRIESDASSRRLAKEANTRNAAQRALEDPHAASALLSLGGVPAILATQWSTSALAQKELLAALTERMSNGDNLAAALTNVARGMLRVTKTAEVGETSPNAVAETSPKATACSAPKECIAEATPLSLWSLVANPIMYGLPTFKFT